MAVEETEVDSPPVVADSVTVEVAEEDAVSAIVEVVGSVTVEVAEEDAASVAVAEDAVDVEEPPAPR